MEPEVIRTERRGRKRRREDVQNALADRQGKKQVGETRSRALVGRYVKKEFEGSGVFLGKIVCYDTGLYSVDYEDGDCEDLESGEVREFLIGDDDFDDALMLRKKKLDELIAKKDVKAKDLVVEGNIVASVNAVEMVEAPSLSEFTNNGANELGAIQVTAAAAEEEEEDSSSDSCEYARDDFSSEVDAPLILPPQLPPSSGNIGVPEEYVSHLFSVYSFLRSFGIQLFLSPFGLDDFVGSLNCPVPNTLLDAVHVALMRALRRRLEMLSSDGSEKASKCLRFNDWSLLDTFTWPLYLVQYLMVMGYINGPEWKGFYHDVLDRNYCTLYVGWKLMILQILCDDVLESEEIRAEIDMREESEVGIDSDAVATVHSENWPRRVHPRYSKTSACKNEEAMKVVAENGTKSFCNSSYLGEKGNEMDVDADTAHDGNSDECRLCGMDGTLLCCDGCPSAYHSRCIGLNKLFIPEGEWHCPECTINKIGFTITRATSLQGAEAFGIDSYGQAFFGTCNHLLVLKFSIDSEPCLRYYNQNDIPNVLQALHSSVEHIFLYSEICKGILQYWDICKDILPLDETFEMGQRPANIKEDGECFTPPITVSGKESHKVKDMVEGENLASCVTGEEPCFDWSLLDTLSQTEYHGQDSGETPMEQFFCLKDTEFSEPTKVDYTMSSSSVRQQVEPSGTCHQSFTGKLSLIEFATCTSRISNRSYQENVNNKCVAVNMSSQRKEGNERVGGRGYMNSSGVCIYMGLHFKSDAYINNYVHGEFAASAAANLAVLSSEENRVSNYYVSDNRRNVVSANMSLQIKAFSSAATRFFWPNSEKKVVEVPRERCGWCFSCKASVASKRGCLLNAAASNAIKGAIKILAGLHPSRNIEGSLPGIAMYVMFMEESLSGLTVGPFQRALHRKQWRKRLEQATTCREIKTLLLEFEENIRIVALSGDWVKLVDNSSIETSVTQSATCAAGLTQKRGPSGRRGRKSSAVSEVTPDDHLDNLNDFNWWRGGMLSKRISQRGVLPRSVVKKAARHGGCRKIPGIYYAESFEIPKRSRQCIWRAAVEMSKNTSQLALQVRYLDLHVRWSDLVRPEQNFQDGKGPETEASAFRNASVCDKKIMKDKIIYEVAFGNQKHLPSRVLKNMLKVDQCKDGKETYWFNETYVPLYLIKGYEENIDKNLPPLADKPVDTISDLQRRQLKASRKDIFCYLSLKRDNLDKCCCASCQLDVLLRDSVKCNTCQGFCHKQCTTGSTPHSIGDFEFTVTCKQCYPAKTLPQRENSKESPNSPLLLQGQKLPNAATVSKGAKQKSINQPLTSVRQSQNSLKTKPAMKDCDLATKNRKLGSWGLIRKKNPENGIDFRLNNILLRSNSDGSWLEPVCHLCHEPYNSDLMYIRCETCKKWYHAEAVELEESDIFDVVGFKCCKCRRIKSPACPYSNPERMKISNAKRPQKRVQKTKNPDAEPDYGTISEQPKDWESTTPLLPTRVEVECAEDDNLFSFPSIGQFGEHNSGMDFEWNTTPASGPGPQKLPVRKHMKHESYVDGASGNDPSSIESSVPMESNNLVNHGEESLAPHLEWDGSMNGFEDGLLLDCDGLNYEDMEFEPQTYFSFAELLASDDGGQLDGIDASGDVTRDWENSSTGPQDGLSDQCEFGTNYQQEPTISVKPAGDR
ncbi:DDT domain-containing protein [Actinidia chinensis var. chinensis]|uniref:DDT domain-containing protein n=1 Tax=Actinidia chinensis var. chinensis TaxID=1590841 RepID=A0A2R6PET1_ACTCC|nr:DDT domain-containing protein [Actinidia chinensis var. chinensis]